MWIYNPKLSRWFSDSAAVSSNGPNDPPAEIPVDSSKVTTQIPKSHDNVTLTPPKPCNCGGLPGARQVR